MINLFLYFGYYTPYCNVATQHCNKGGMRQANMGPYQANTHTGQLVTGKRQAIPRAYQADNGGSKSEFSWFIWLFHRKCVTLCTNLV